MHQHFLAFTVGMCPVILKYLAVAVAAASDHCGNQKGLHV